MTLELAKERVLRRARSLGVDAEVLAVGSRELTVSAKDGRPDELSLASRGGIGVRVVREGRVGYASTEALDDASLDWMLDEAIENAGLQPDRGVTLPVGEPLGAIDLLGEGLTAAAEVKRGAAVSLERALVADARVDALFVCRYSESEVQITLGSTRGVDGGYRNGFAALMASPVMKQGDSVKQGWDLAFGKEVHALDPGRTAQTILARVGRHLGATPLATGRYVTMFEPDVVATLLRVLLFSLSGKTLAEGKTLLAGKLGQRIASDHVTLVDDPTLASGLGSRPFDAEGTPAQRTVLVERGNLRAFLHNSDTARRTGHANTGHAERGYASALGVGISNLIFEPGAGVELSDGVIVTDLMGVHAGANPITGEASLQGLGLRVEAGEARPVEDFAVSFNLFRLLEGVEGVGDALEWRPGGGLGVIGAPTVLVGELSFGGA